ncbi:5-formyltetrahydrofolate cyclo-ligase [Nocardiopsis lambiniae]|uniref:5-formyltetrahydrofolate cyclo-ligase n=1 Tax=Nocardiopsis lambiniae TaxID=3075539 RepID=A0ABU2M8T3_9ACTN|nr:5-formyltetrahydrofolate cyclo-ligase [Nocardiopsis sp. DSM 44743]MDT0329020.1 5-formyltetrahydrofolate cyclo-ligase [Nocardiopsis sp. DSM 44743]
MDETARSEKRRMRRRLLDARRAMDSGERERAGSVVRDALTDLPWLAMSGTVACYHSVGTEPGTHRLITALWKRGTYVLLPIFLPDGNLDWAAYDGPESLAPAGHGLLEPTGHRYGVGAPATVDAMVCPALAVDRSGGRLGRGAGCYDRALALRGPHCPAIAVVYDDEFVDEVPGEAHDLRVDAVITPGGGLRVFDSGVWPDRNRGD